MITRRHRKRLQDIVHAARIAGRASEEECIELCGALDLAEMGQGELEALIASLGHHIQEFDGLVPDAKNQMWIALLEKLRAAWSLNK